MVCVIDAGSGSDVTPADVLGPSGWKLSAKVTCWTSPVEWKPS